MRHSPQFWSAPVNTTLGPSSVTFQSVTVQVTAGLCSESLLQSTG